MIYKINNSYYVKVQGHFKEVDITMENDELLIKPNGKDISVYGVYAQQVSTDDIKEDLKKPKENKFFREEKNKKRM